MAFKILSLDGGGSWALIQARVLQDIYGDIRGHQLLKKFDLAIANSGGSLVLAALCNNMLLSEVIDVFEDQTKREQVFSKMSLEEKLQHTIALLRGITGVGPKYSTPEKLIGLVNVLTEADTLYHTKKIDHPIVKTYLDEIPAIIGNNYNGRPLQLVIVGYDYFRKRANFFRSNLKASANRFSDKIFRVTLGDAIHASSNAPVNYFDDPATIKISAADEARTTWYWDGAVSGFNNPVLAGLIEAITNDVKPADCRILTIGTGIGERAVITDYGTSTDPKIKAIYDANVNNSLVITNHAFDVMRDIKELATSILADPPDSDTFIAYSMLHPDLTKRGDLVRINPCLTPVLNKDTNIFGCPAAYNGSDADKTAFQTLLDMDMDAVEQEQVDLITGLCNKFIAHNADADSMPNQLIRGSLNSPGYLGHACYIDARRHWGGLTGD